MTSALGASAAEPTNVPLRGLTAVVLKLDVPAAVADRQQVRQAVLAPFVANGIGVFDRIDRLPNVATGAMLEVSLNTMQHSSGYVAFGCQILVKQVGSTIAGGDGMLITWEQTIYGMAGAERMSGEDWPAIYQRIISDLVNDWRIQNGR